MAALSTADNGRNSFYIEGKREAAGPKLGTPSSPEAVRTCSVFHWDSEL